jgi:branched-chain amino acid transport system substrate-binding protein
MTLRRTLWILLGLFLIVLVGILVWCSRHGTASGGLAGSSDEVKIGAIDPLTGPFAAYGEPVRDGMLLAVDQINASGGIKGRKIALDLEDDGGDPKNTISIFTKLATVEGVPIVIGPLSSGTSMAVAPLADRYHVVELATLAGTIDLTRAGDYVFRIYPSSEIGSRYIANVAITRFKAKRIAILYPNNALGVTSRKFVTDVVSRSSAQVVAVETYQDGDRDFRTQLTRIAASKPDVILCSAYYEEGAQILIQAHQLGLDVPVLGEDGWFGPIAQIAGPALKNLYFANVAFGPDNSANRDMQVFIAAFHAKYGHMPNSYAAAGFAAVYIVKHAIEVGGYDGAGIKAALYNINMVTPFGRVKYDSNGDNVGAAYALFQLGSNNEPLLAK